MREPYLILGVKLVSTSPAHLSIFRQAMRDIEDLLAGNPLTEFKIPGIFVAELNMNSDDAWQLWHDVAQVLSDADGRVDDDLQWLAHLADRNGCELAGN